MNVIVSVKLLEPQQRDRDLESCYQVNCNSHQSYSDDECLAFFKQVDFMPCSTPLEIYACGGTSRDEMKKILENRKMVIEKITKCLTDHLLQSMESRDLEYGYKKEPLERIKDRY